MIKNYQFKSPVTKEILDNGTEIWRNNLKKNLCAFTPNHTIFYDGKDSFWIYGDTPIKAYCGRIEATSKVREFYKGSFCHIAFMESKVTFLDSNNLSIFEINLDKPIRLNKKERIENHFKDNRLSIMFTETENRITELLSEDFFPYIDIVDTELIITKSLD